MAQTDILRFFSAWLRAPLRVASVTPSSNSLSALMTEHISPSHGPVLELGPGTGVFTSALLKRGIAERDITLIEYGPEFVPLLKVRFPDTKLYQMDARHIGERGLFEDAAFGNVISGLPLLSMKPAIVLAILAGCFSRLRRDGGFYQFTYGPKCPVSSLLLHKLDLKAEKTGWTFRNFPPASVYRITRHQVPLLGNAR